MKNPIIYIVLNGELKMSPGKAAAQAVHAALLFSANAHGDLLSSYKRTVVVLEAKNSDQLKNLYEYLDDTDIEADYYIDEGKNEVDAYSATALAAGPIEHEDLEKREIFADFPLFGFKKDRWGERFWHI
jgi:peptidyl-tRNA hydrolase